MALVGLLGIFLTFIILRCLRNKDGLPTNWPVIGMLPALLLQVHRRNYDWITQLLLKSHCNFLFKGPWFFNMNILFIADPANIHYIMNSNFANFHKGPEHKSIFDVLGDGIFNSDTDTWRNQRKVAMASITHKSFHKFLVRATTDKVQNGLVLILNDASEKGCVVDLQDIFQRFTFDSTCKLVMGIDSGCLSSEFPEIPFALAVEDGERAIFYRHVVPELFWKLQRWLGVGAEKKMSKAWVTFDEIIGKYLEEKREDVIRKRSEKLQQDDDEQGTDLIASYIRLGFDDNRYLRDTVLNFVIAGRDTVGSALTWFFWNLSHHPSVEEKIREEINSVSATEEIGPDSSINKLVYLHGAIYETLRLFPSVPLNHKRAIKPDILPSGHSINPNMRILLSVYAMGRMPSIWGIDCLEFRPERWITNKGGFKYEPSHKFLTFGAGPRTCLGKDVTFTQMKNVIINIIQKFDFEVIGHHQAVKPSRSIILQMEDGLKVKVAKRLSPLHEVK